MSSFSLPPLSGLINFDVSQFTGAMSQVANTAGAFPGMIQSGLDAPLKQAQEAMAHTGQSAAEIGNSVEHGMMGAEAAMKLFPALVVEFIENPILGAIALLVELGAKAKEAVEFLGDTLKEVATHAGDTAFGAEKAGVSPEFFSTWEEAGRTVRVNGEQISQGIKFLQKNAVDAVDGVEPAKKGFNDLGISQQFLAENLNNTEAIWDKVHEKISALPTAAERARRSMEVLGKGGADMALLLGMPAEQLDKLTESAKRFGVIDDGKSAETGKKFEVATVQMSQAWEGLKKKLSDPILDYFAEHWDEMLPKIEKIADAIGRMIPDALDLMRDAFTAALHGIGAFLAALEPVAKASDALGVTHSAYQAVHEARDIAHNIRIELGTLNFHIDPQKASEQVAEQVKPYIYDAVNQHARQMKERAPHHMKETVASAIGGRSSGGHH